MSEDSPAPGVAVALPSPYLPTRSISAIAPCGARTLAPAMKKMFMDFYNENMTSPYVAAERGYVDAMVMPSETRVQLRRALEQLRDKELPQVRKKREIAPM